MKNWIIILIIAIFSSCQDIGSAQADADQLTKLELTEQYKDSLVLKLSVPLDSCLELGVEMDTYMAAFRRIYNHSELIDNKIVVNIPSHTDVKIDKVIYDYIVNYFGIVNRNAEEKSLAIINSGQNFLINHPKTKAEDEDDSEVVKFVVRNHHKESFRFACLMIKSGFMGNTGDIIAWDECIPLMSYNRIYDQYDGSLDSWVCQTSNSTRYGTYRYIDAQGPDKNIMNNFINTHSLDYFVHPTGHIEVTDRLINANGIVLLKVVNSHYNDLFEAKGYYEWPNHVP
ncbi:MAG: hypothetical protein ACRDDZ_12600 [Marinifilaceae bacterium]